MGSADFTVMDLSHACSASTGGYFHRFSAGLPRFRTERCGNIECTGHYCTSPWALE
jgi:hypothetical protein